MRIDFNRSDLNKAHVLVDRKISLMILLQMIRLGQSVGLRLSGVRIKEEYMGQENLHVEAVA